MISASFSACDSADRSGSSVIRSLNHGPDSPSTTSCAATQKRPYSTPAGTPDEQLPLVQLSKRLYQIALYDHHVPLQDRETALKLVEGVDRDIAAAVSDKPDALRALREATAHMKDNAKFVGYGSLSWLLEENQVPDDRVVEFVMRPEHAPLLKSALHVMGNDAATKAKPEMVRELIRQRPLSLKTSNAVLILHGLACALDQAVEALVTEPELRAIREAHRDYTSARNVLVALGVLPATSSTRPIEPSLSGDTLGELVLFMLKEEWDDPLVVEFLKSIDEELRQGLRLASFLLGINLSVVHIGAVYGKTSQDELRSFLLQALPEMRKSGFGHLLDQTLVIVEKVAFANMRHSPDLLILELVLHGGEDKRTEAQFEATKTQWMKGGELLTRYRVMFLDRLRFMLRWHAAKAADSSLAGPSGDAEDCIN